MPEENKELIEIVLKEINYIPTRYGGKYDAISIPEIIERTIDIARKYFEENNPNNRL